MRKQLIYMAAALLLAGCSADDMPEETPDDGLVPIRLSSGLEVQGRAHTDMDAQIPAGQNVAFWVDNAASPAQLYGNNVLTSDGANGFTGSATMYFPRSDDNVDIYALYTNATLEESFPAAAITHTVAADQTAADYYNSDLLYGASKDVAKTTNAVPITFYHMLSKVRVAIKAGTAETNLAGATVRIVGTKTAADFTPSKTASMTGQAARAAMVAASGSAAEITVSNEASADFTTANVKYNDAVVVPQTIAAGMAFISITLSDNTELTWSPVAEQTFESGKCYTYHVTVTRTGLNVASSVTGWEYSQSGWLEDISVRGVAIARIPAGTFLMGQTGVATPVHEVTLTQDFYMGRYEVTQEQYAEFLNAVGIPAVRVGEHVYYTVSGYGEQRLFSVYRGSSPEWSDATGRWEADGSFPMTSASWYGAKAYADWIGGSLPTEAQWEYACRAGTTTLFHFGDDETQLGDYGWFSGNSSNALHPVGMKLPNAYGLYDMLGNAYEMCSDWYGAYGSDPATDPTGPTEPGTFAYRVIRGGGYYFGASDCRSAARALGSTGATGFRVVFVL